MQQTEFMSALTADDIDEARRRRVRMAMRKWRSTGDNAERERAKAVGTGRARKASHKYRYGITHEQRDAMLRDQHGKCAICEADLDFMMASDGVLRFPVRKGWKRRSVVDHSHLSGKVRAILCNHCNVILGLAKENADILRKAIHYLEKFSQ